MHKTETRLRNLKQQKPDLVLILLNNVQATAQPRVSQRLMLEHVCEIVQEQLKNGRHAEVNGFDYMTKLWATRHPESRGPRNGRLLADEEHPMFPLQSFVCVGVSDSPVARGTLRDYLVRQCVFCVVGPEAGLPSNKLVRVLSSLNLGPEAKATCSCGAADKRFSHYEDLAGSSFRQLLMLPARSS